MRTARAALLVAALVSATASAADEEESASPWQAIAVSARPVPFATFDDETEEAGRLRFRGGLVLTSSDDRFGGLSGLAVSAGGARFRALSDRGHWFEGDLVYADGRLTDVANVRIATIETERGLSTTNSRDGDSESLTPATPGDMGGAFFAGFEDRHRIARYSFANDDPGAPLATFTPKTDRRIPGNGGFEAIVMLPDHRLLAMTEDLVDAHGNTVGFLLTLDEKGIADQASIAMRRIEPFVPTDLTLLPGGDLMVLERRFSPLQGVGMQMRLIKGADVKEGAVLDGPVVANLDMRYVIDNMEGLSARRGENGETLLYAVSDDNFNAPIQRTLLLMFALGADEAQ